MDGATLAYVSSWASLISLVLAFVNTYLILRIKAGNPHGSHSTIWPDCR